MPRSPRTSVLLISCPPWRTECPNLALAYLSTMLRRNGIGTWVSDLSVELYNRVEPSVRKYWDLTSSTFWYRMEVLTGAFSDSANRYLDSFVAEVAEREGDIVGFSTQSANAMFTLELVRRLRERGCKKTIVLGGPSIRLGSPTDPRTIGITGFRPRGLNEAAAAEEIRPFLDLVDVFVEGEGEFTLLELAQRHSAGVPLDGTPGAIVWHEGEPAPYTPRSVVADLDEIPHPTFEEFDLSAYGLPVLPFLTSRGCVRKCAMCYERILWPGFRHRGIRSIVEEMEHHVARWGVNQFSCNDLLLNGNLLFLGNLCDAIAESKIDVDWWGNAVVHRLMDRDLFRRMKAGRLNSLIYGIESGSQKVLRKMRKGYLIDDADQVLQYGSEVGISNVINLMVGFPGEDDDDHRQTLEFVDRNHGAIHRVAVLAMCMIYPKSPLSEQWEYYGIDASSLEQHNPYSVNVDWKDLNGMDAATRQGRFWQLFRLIRSYGIEVMGVADEEEITPQLVEELVQNLDSGTSWVREDAIVRLARARDGALIPVMERALRDDSFLVIGQALLNLTRLDPDKAWDAARDLFHSGVSYIEYTSCFALASRVDARTLDLLETRLEAPIFAHHSSELQKALAPHRAAVAAVEAFRAAVERQEPGALEALLGHELSWVRLRGLRWLVEQSPGSIPGLGDALLAALRAHDDVEVRFRLLRALEVGQVDVDEETLEQLYRDADLQLRATARKVARLQAERQTVLQSAAESGAAESEAEQVPPALQTRWPADGEAPDAEVERRRMATLAKLADGPPPPCRTVFLCRALVEGSQSLKLAAFEALLTWEDWRYLEEAAMCVIDPVPQVRRRAAEYIGRSGDRLYEQALLRALDDERLFVVQEAVTALARLKSPYLARRLSRFMSDEWLEKLPETTIRLLDESRAEKASALALLETAAREGPDSLQRAFRDGTPFARVVLVRELAAARLPFDVSPLLGEALRDPEEEVRLAALDRLLEAERPAGLDRDVERLLLDTSQDCRLAATRFFRQAPVPAGGAAAPARSA